MQRRPAEGRIPAERAGLGALTLTKPSALETMTRHAERCSWVVGQVPAFFQIAEPFLTQ